MGQTFAHCGSFPEGLGRLIKTIDISQLLDDSRWTTYQKLLTALAALAVIFDGCDIQLLGVAIPSLMSELHVARSAFGPVLAIGLAGMALGSPFAGYLGDRFGRRPALIGCVCIFGIATIATAFTHSVAAIAILRFFTGMGAGGALPNASALVAELAPLRRRPMAVKLTILCVPLGGMIAGLFAARILPSFGWRALYLMGGAAPVLLSFILFWLLPESPRYLVRHPALWPRLAALLVRMGHPPVSGTCHFQDGTEQPVASSLSPLALFAPGLARNTFGLWTAFFFCLGSIYLVFGWLPALLASQGLGVAVASSGLAGYNFGGVLGVLCWTVLLTRFGSRVPMLVGALATAATAVLLLLIPVHGDATALIGGITVNGLFANAVQTSMYALAAHVYPAGIRATGVAYAASIGRVGAIVSSLLGAVVIQSGPSTYWYVIAAAMLVAFGGLAWVRGHFQGTHFQGTK